MKMLEAIPDRADQPTPSRWKETAASIGGCLLFLAFSFGGLVLLVFLLTDVGWVTANIYPWTTLAAEIASLVIVPVSVLLAIFRKSRGIGAIGLLISSHVIALGLWLWSLIIAYTLAGVSWLIVGLVLGGIGVVPIALVAALASGEWSIAGEILIGAIAVYTSRAFGMFLAERAEDANQRFDWIREKVTDYREAVNRELEIDNTLLSACRQEFGEGYGPSGLQVCAYAAVVAKGTIENSHSRSKSELASTPEEIKQAIAEVAELAITGNEDSSALDLLKMLYTSLARFLPDPQAVVVTARNVGWLSEDRNHPGLKRSKEAEQIEAEIDDAEARLAKEFDEIRLELLRTELAKAKSEKTKATMQLLEVFHQLNPDDHDFVEDALLEEFGNVALKEGTSDRYVRDALTAWRQDDRETALSLFTKAIEIDPDDGTAILNRGNLQLEMGYFDDGIADLERARDLDPELPWQNALLFKMLTPEQRERTRQVTLTKKEKKGT